MIVDGTAHESLETMPVRLPSAPASPAQRRARYFNSGNAFNVHLPDVPAAAFVTEAAAARVAGTGLVACDQSAALGLSFAATTPLMLARYAAIAPHQTLTAAFVAGGAIWYVIDGDGDASVAGESLRWGRGDVFLTPADDVRFTAGSHGALLWVVTDEPLLAQIGAAPAPTAATEPVHYPAAEIERQLARVVAAPRASTTSGIALIFSAQQNEESRNILPVLTLSLNTLPPGEHQRRHRHDAAAITLVIAGGDCHSRIGDERCEWSPSATLVTPPGAPHSHHNDGDERAIFLIVQDGGLHYHARTMGFTFLETESPDA